jgi:hypothetical protein
MIFSATSDRAITARRSRATGDSRKIVGECSIPDARALQDRRSLTDLALIFHRQTPRENPPLPKTR